MADRPSLTIAQAVEQFEISRATVRRGIESGRFPRATKDSAGRWMIPIEDLIGAQVPGRKTWLTEGTHQGDHPAHDEHPQGTQGTLDPLQTLVASELAHQESELARELAHERARVAQLETQLEAEKQLREASERNAEDLRTAMRMIEAGRKPAPTREEQPVPRRRWWQRKPQ